MNAQERINELQKRQVFYGSSMVVKLNAIDGLFYFSVYAWVGNTKILVIDSQKYNAEDPLDLIQAGLFELNLKKIKTGVPIK